MLRESTSHISELNASSQMTSSAGTEQEHPELIRHLCREIQTSGITYCHWKSNLFLDRSMRGENDLDLLVARADADHCAKLLCRLGFKQTYDSPARQMPGIVDYYGFDAATGKLIHAHVHYQLVVGHDATKNYHLPMEQAYLNSAVQRDELMVPIPELEFIVFVLRMTLKHSTWDTILAGQGSLSTTERQELEYLQSHIAWPLVYDFLGQQLPSVDADLFDACVRSLEIGCSTWVRVSCGLRLQRSLRAHARRSGITDLWLKGRDYVITFFQRRVLKRRYGKKHFAGGGLMIVLVGGDGAGKSTAISALQSWLAKDFEVVRLHLGKPAWSMTTIAVRGCLKIGVILHLWPFMNAPLSTTIQQEPEAWIGYPWLLREICTARDRSLAYAKARRFAANGGIVLVDRFPLAMLKLMDGPQCEKMTRMHRSNAVTRWLVAKERSYYQHLAWPDLLFVLRLPPDLAVHRKPDEDSKFVWERSQEVWSYDWEQTPAVVIDAKQSREQVLAALKAALWLRL